MSPKPKPEAPKPEPVVVQQVCSLCGEDWNGHIADDKEPTVLDCIRVLKERAAKPSSWYLPNTTGWYGNGFTTTPNTTLLFPYQGNQQIEPPGEDLAS